MKRTLLGLLFTLSVLYAPAGIYRHDVVKKEYTDLGASPEFDCVGRVLKTGEKGDASCVLISEKYLVTAAHVVILTKTKPEEHNMNGVKMTVYKTVSSEPGKPEDFTFRFKGKDYRAKRIMIHPAYLAEDTKGNCDIALVELTERVAGVKPAVPNNNSEWALHKKVTGVGYGASGPANKPQDVTARLEKIAGENTIDSVGGYRFNGTPTLLMADMDHPDNSSCNKMGAAKPCELEYMLGGGDSGGGLFCQVDGEWRLVGISAGTNTDIQVLLTTGYYGQTMSWTNITPFLTWMKELKYNVGE